MQKVKLSIKNRVVGLYLYCNKCKRYYSSDIKVKCKCPNLIYRAKIHVAGTKNKCRIENLLAKTVEDAIIELSNYKKNLIANSYQNQSQINIIQKPILLTDCMAKYISYLNNEGVPLHKHKNRSEGHINDYVRNFKYYIDALKVSSVDVSILKFTSVNDIHVGYIHSFILNERKLGNTSYNNIIAAYRIFTSHIINEYKLSYTNPFEGVNKRYVNSKNTTVSKNDFYNLLEVIKPENGIKTLSTGERKNLYKDWLIDAFWLGLFTGGRRDAIINLRWSDIEVDENKVPSHINISDYKNNKSKSNLVNENEKKVDRAIIYKEFYDYLVKLGYEKYKNSDRYILASESTMKRETMKNVISKAFSHFAQIINPEKKLLFKHLRKTFSTSAYMQFGSEANFLTGHNGIDVMKGHYLDKTVVQKRARESFEIFNEKV